MACSSTSEQGKTRVMENAPVVFLRGFRAASEIAREIFYQTSWARSTLPIFNH